MKALLAIIGLVWGGSVAAGAWPREKGDWFIAVGANVLLSDGSQLPVHYDPTLYLEYGLTDRIVVGVDAYTANKGDTVAALGFARIPLGDVEAAHKFAISFALGARDSPGKHIEYLWRPALHWGHGLENGWLSVDASATYRAASQTFLPKLDATWGYRLDDRWTGSVQVQTGVGISGDFYAKLNPAISYRLTDTTEMNLGVIKGMTGDGGAGLKLEAWFSF